MYGLEIRDVAGSSILLVSARRFAKLEVMLHATTAHKHAHHSWTLLPAMWCGRLPVFAFLARRHSNLLGVSYDRPCKKVCPGNARTCNVGCPGPCALGPEAVTKIPYQCRIQQRRTSRYKVWCKLSCLPPRTFTSDDPEPYEPNIDSKGTCAHEGSPPTVVSIIHQL